jgi:large subunit ribosomal protein L24
MHVKKGDKVKVIAGKEKGKTGTVTVVLAKENRVVLDGLNLVKRHMRPRKAGEKGQIISKPASMHASNVALVDGKTKAPKAKAPATPAKKAVKKVANKV